MDYQVKICQKAEKHTTWKKFPPNTQRKYYNIKK